MTPIAKEPWIVSAAEPIIRRALDEDLGAGDVTSRACVPAGTHATATMVAKDTLVFCGGDVGRRVFELLDPSVSVEVRADDGLRVSAGSPVMQIEGDARALLAAERTALNLLQRMSGIATRTRAFADAATGTCRVVDTRKTAPGLRVLDRYAVRCGGGHNHRNDLGGGVLIKENHIRAAGGVASAVKAARRHAPHALRVECEVTDLDELQAALDAGADAVLLDNMDDAAVKEAVDRVAGRAVVEASGNVTLERIPSLSATGVDLISVGALTHSVVAADLSLLFES